VDPLTDGPYRPLPANVAGLLVELAAPPRLTAHLRIVHDTACELTESLDRRYPGVSFDRDQVQFGAATHDIGKVLYPEEISGPGSAHEFAGQNLLLDRGFDARLARFARDHASWAESAELEDLLVSLADKIWKGKRVETLEDLVVDRLARATGLARWQVFVALDDLIAPIAAGADSRLAFQSGYPQAVS
jgi:hypothetical protein